MSFAFDLHSVGLPEAAVAVEEVESRLSDATVVLEAIHESFQAYERARFDAEGPGWAELAPSTLAEKARKGYPSTILEASGALLASLTVTDAPGSVWEHTGTLAVMGTDLKPEHPGSGWEDWALAAFHQQGTSRMPARPVIDIPAEAPLTWSQWWLDWMTGGVVPAYTGLNF